MADLSITVADIALGGDAVATNFDATASEAITQGHALVRDTSTSKYAKAINTSEATAVVAGIALTKTSADGDKLFVVTSGPLIIGATLVPGETYFLSDTAGGIMPSSDLSTGDWVTRIGQALTTTLLQLDISPYGVQAT